MFDLLLFPGSPDVKVVNKAENYTDGEKYSQYSVPGRSLSIGYAPDKDDDEIGQANFKGEGV